MTTPEADDRPNRPNSLDIQIAILCEYRHAADAIEALFDIDWFEDHELSIDKILRDGNMYSLGMIGHHNVVLVHIPPTGKASDAVIARSFRSSFPNIKLALVVGVCGVVPFGPGNEEIVLGDVVISDSIVQFDDRGLVIKHSPRLISEEMQLAMAKLWGHRGRKRLRRQLRKHLDGLQSQQRPGCRYPGKINDALFEAEYVHKDKEKPCKAAGCDGNLLQRRRLQPHLDDPHPAIHYGLVASGGFAMSGKHRDAFAKEEKVIAFETASCDVWDTLPCVVIKGACDYADDHKNKSWHQYAAATAASCAKAFLSHWVPVHLKDPPSIEQEPTNPCFILPRKNEAFVWRHSLLKDLHRKLFQSAPGSGVALVGPVGIGKTQVALAYAHWLRETHPKISVFWVNADSVVNLHESYRAIAKKYQIPGHEDQNIDILTLVQKWLEEARHGRWLMVLDGTDYHRNQHFNLLTDSIFDSSGSRERSVLRYLPVCSHGSIIATARDGDELIDVLLRHGLVEILNVYHMDEYESRSLFRAVLGDVEASDDDISSISSRLQYLPLALARIAVYISQLSITPREFLHWFDKEIKDLEALSKRTRPDFTMLWMPPFRNIKQESLIATEILFLVSFFNKKAIPMRFLSRYIERRQSGRDHQLGLARKSRHRPPQLQLIDAIKVLRRYSVVRAGESGTIDMHRLTQLTTQRWLIDNGSFAQFAGEALLTVSEPYSNPDSENSTRCDTYLPHLYSVLDCRRSLPKREMLAKASLLHNAAAFLTRHGQWKESERLQLQAINIRKDFKGEAHPSTLASMANLSATYRHQGRWGDAGAIELQVAETTERVLGNEHPDTLIAMTRLASTYKNQGRLEEAEAIEVNVRRTSKQVLGEEHPHTLSRLGDLALVYKDQGRWDDAEGLAMEIRLIMQQLLGKKHPSTIRIIETLAQIHDGQSQFGKAEPKQIQVTGGGGRAMSDKFLAGLSTETHLKEVERDSGYASASRIVPSTRVSESHLLNGPSTAAEMVDQTAQSGDDIQSLASNNDDIGSQASHETTQDESSGRALIGSFLTEQRLFKILCERSMASMGTGRFTENMRRLLKLFHMDLVGEAKSEAQRSLANLLRGRRGRSRISKQIARHIELEESETLEDQRPSLAAVPEDEYKVESWLAQVSKVDDFKGISLPVKQEVYSNSDDSSEEADLPHLAEIRGFLQQSISFQNLQRDLLLMLLPLELGSILCSISSERIWLSKEQEPSVLNRAKAWVEDQSQTRWDWWPLQPRKHILQGGGSRVFWNCTCGTERWEDITAEQYDLVERILALPDRKISTHPCKARCRGAPLAAWIKTMFRRRSPSSATQPSSSAAMRYTPLGNRALSSSGHSQGESSSQSIPSQSEQQDTFVDRRVHQATIQKRGEQYENWILFGVRGAGRKITPEQIAVSSETQDCDIIQKMKTHYRAHRGWLRLWLSVWHLEYCDIVKFYRRTPYRLIHEHRDLPTDMEYQYAPRPDAKGARNPPISAHAFESLFYSCPSPCTSRVPHDCIPPPEGAIYLTRIPKRVRNFEANEKQPIWGLETVLSISFLHVVAYHCVMVPGPFIFWAWWLAHHPGDLQSASVPAAIVLGALSLFWSVAGILTNRKTD